MVTIKIQKVVAYCRVSSESQIDNTSIEEQRKKIEAYCVSQDLELVKIFVDEGISASDTKNRPGYNEMMEFINDNDISGIVVTPPQVAFGVSVTLATQTPNTCSILALI